jgi:hypothetical protein
MPLPKNKVTVYDKRIALYKKRIDKLKEVGRDARVHYGHVVAKHINAERNLRDQIDSLTTAALQDRFKLQDYEAQIANQWRENAELRDDLARAKLMHDAKAKELTYMHRQYRDQVEVVMCLERQLAAAKSTTAYLIRQEIATQWQALRKAIATRKARVKLAFTIWKSQIVNRWMIKRLSKARVAALYEAGHIPDKLVRSALAFYEHDKKRLDLDEQIKYIHYGSTEARTSTKVMKETRPPLLRRIKIWMGRA